MKNKVNKGFFKEIASKPTSPKQNKSFAYKKPVVKNSNETNSMATPYRLREFKTAKTSKSSLVQEHATHVKKRKGEE